MAIRNIIWTVSDDGLSISPTSPQPGGVQGENNATEVIFRVGEGSVWADAKYKVYVECEDAVGHHDATQPLQVEGGQISVLLPLAWTQYGGMTTLRLVAEEEDGVIAYTVEGKATFVNRNNSAQKADGLLRGRLAEVEARLNDVVETAETAAGEAQKAADSAVYAAGSASTSREGAYIFAKQAEASSATATDAAVAAKKSAAEAAVYAAAAAQGGGGGWPGVTDEDNDKVLTVVNGKPQWALHAGISNKQKVVFADDGEGNVSIVLVEEEAPKDETVTVTNLVTNSHFDSGMDSWSDVSYQDWAVCEVIDGELCLHTWTNNAKHIRQKFADQTAIIIGHRYYLYSRIKTVDKDYYRLDLKLTGTSVEVADQSDTPPVVGDWSFVSNISTLTAAPSSKYLSFWVDYTNQDKKDIVVYIDDVVAIDLTATFGAGNEPDLATMDEWIHKQYPNGFDGSVELVVREAENDAGKLADRVDAIEKQVASLSTGSTTQTGTVYPTLDAHYIANIEEARPVYYNAQEANALTFAMLSDIHLITAGSSQSANVNISKNVEASSAWAKLVNHDFVMLGGDLIVDYYDKPTALSLIDKVVEMAEKHARCPVYTVKGNHDTNEGVSADIPEHRLTDKEFYIHANARGEKYGMVTDPDHPYGGYYYVDFPKQKIRLVCLNTSENNANYDILTSTKAQFRYIGVFSPNQMAWIENVALRVNDGWAVMMVSHIPPFQADNFYNRGTDNPALRALCEAFAAGTGSFAVQGAREFIGHFSGHAHIDAYNKVGGLNYVLVNCTTPEKRWELSLDRTEDEDKMSLNSFIVDRANRTVKCIKIGAAPADDYDGWVDSFTW